MCDMLHSCLVFYYSQVLSYVVFQISEPLGCIGILKAHQCLIFQLRNATFNSDELRSTFQFRSH